MKRIDSLRALQVVDLEWDSKARRYQTLRANLSDQSELASRRSQRQALQAELAAAKSSLRNAELELAGLQQKAHAVEKELYSGRNIAPKELDNQRRDSMQLKQRIGALEEHVLELMSQVEDLEARDRDMDAELLTYEREAAALREQQTEEYAQLRLRLKALQETRDRLRGTLGRADLALYDELRSKKSGTALAPLVDGVCQICHVTVPTSKVSLVEAGEQVATCEGCGRILYQE